MSLILIVSILIRLAAMFWSIVLLQRIRDWRMGFLTLMLALMAARQILTMLTGMESMTILITGDTTELPGLAVGIMAFLAVIFMERFITDRRRAEDRVLRQSAVLNAINKVFREALTCETEEQIARKCHAVAKDLTGSKFGFIGELNEAGRFDTIALSDVGLKACKMPASEASVIIKDMEIRGIWGRVFKDEQSLIVNDPFSHPDRTGTPEGHPLITSFLGVPLKYGDKIIGMIALANKESGYNPVDQENIETLSVAFVEALMRKRAEQAVQSAREYAECIVETVREPLIVLDNKMKIITVNYSFCKTFRLTHEETRGIFLYELGNKQWDIPKLRDLLENILPMNTTIDDFEVEHDFPNIGQRTMLINARRIYRETNKTQMILLAFEDITERRRAEDALRIARDELEVKVAERTRELAQANIQLQELDRLKSMFIASMSHELRTPLNSIIGFTGIILQGMAGEITKEQSKQLTMVKNSAEHLLALINDVIDVSKIEAGKVEPAIEEFDFLCIIREVKDSFEVIADEKGLKLSIEMPDKLVIKSDERRTKQIIMNLVNNAVKFTDRGKIEIKAAKKDRRVEISVRDTGIGIKKEDMAKLFKAFSRVREVGMPVWEGTGLGLYISKKLADLLGGEIQVESEWGRGSEFTFTLPLEYNKVKK